MVKLSLINDFEKTSSYWDKNAIILISLHITDYAWGFFEKDTIPEELYVITSDLDRIYLSSNPKATPETEADFIIRTWRIRPKDEKPGYVSIDWSFCVMGDCSESSGRCSINDCGGSDDILVFGELADLRLAAYKGQPIITIPKDVEIIDRSLFKGFSNLEEVIISEGISRIGDFAFAWCRNLKSISIPKSVKRVGESAFCGCISLNEVRLPDGVTEIGEKAFAYCRNLSEVTIPVDLKVIGKNAFGHSYFWFMAMCNQPDFWFDLCGIKDEDEEYENHIRIVNIIKASQDEPDEEMRVLTIFKHCFQELYDSFDLDSFQGFIAERFQKEWFKNYCDKLDGRDSIYSGFIHHRLKTGHTERQDRFTHFMRDYPMEALMWLDDVDGRPFYAGLASGNDYDLIGLSKEGFLEFCDEYNWDDVFDNGGDVFLDFDYAPILEEEYGADFAADYLKAIHAGWARAIDIDGCESEDCIQYMEKLSLKCDNDFLLSQLMSYYADRDVDKSLEYASKLAEIRANGLRSDEWIIDALDWVFMDFEDSTFYDDESYDLTREWLLKLLNADFSAAFADLLAPFLSDKLKHIRENKWTKGVQAIETFLNR